MEPLHRVFSSPAARPGGRLRALLAVPCLFLVLVPGPGVAAAAVDFRRGDSNTDGRVDIADAVASLGFLFSGGALVTCLDAADSNDDGQVNITDPIATLGMLFLGTPAHPAPGPLVCGPDATGDALGCERYELCPPPGGENVALERESAVRGTIGPEGGTLETQAADGTRYTFTAPADSLPVGTEITMTPVVDIGDYPIASGVAAGADFEPAGLVFAAPALLRIATARTPPAGTTAVALLHDDAAGTYARAIFGAAGGEIAIPVEHFSDATVGFATAAELEALASFAPAPCLVEALAPLGASPPDVDAAIDVFRQCFEQDVLPAIEQAANDQALARAIGQLRFWTVDARLSLGMPDFDDSSELAQARGALVPKLQEAIIRNNDRCRTQQSFASLANVLFWQSQAERFGIATPGNLLDRATVLRDLCARVVVDGVELPDDLQVGFPHSLDLRFGIVFAGQAESQGAPFRVQIAASGLDVQNPTGFSNAQGDYTTVVTATQAEEVSLVATGCLIIPGTTTPTDVCVTEEVNRDAQDLTGLWGGTFAYHVVAGDISQQRTLGLELRLEQNQNAISGRVTTCDPPGARGVDLAPFSATLSGSQLINAATDLLAGCAPEICSGLDCVPEGTGTVDGDTITLDLFDGTCFTEGGVGTMRVQISVTRGTEVCQ